MEDMKPVTRALQTLAAIESETRELIHAEAPSTGSTETDAEIVPLVQKIGARSIAEIEKLIGEMQEAKNFLQTEWERIQRETARYTIALPARSRDYILAGMAPGRAPGRGPRPRQQVEQLVRARGSANWRKFDHEQVEPCVSMAVARPNASPCVAAASIQRTFSEAM
jgi:hypothetical protein